MNAILALAAALVAAVTSGCATPPTSPPSPGPTAQVSPPRPATPPTAPAAAPRAAISRQDLSAAEAEAPPPDVELSPQLLFQLLAADLAAQRGEVGSAWSTYMSIARQTRDPRVARRATEIAVGARALDEAAQSAQLWRELSPQSRAATQMLESLWLGAGRFKDVEPMLGERLARARAEGTLPAAYVQLQRSLLRVQDRAGAWQMVRRLSEPDLEIAAARLARAQLAAGAGEVEASVAEALEAMRLAPDDEDAVVVAARAMHALPARKQEALETLDRFLQRQPMALEARYAYARLLLADGRAEDARAQLERTLAQQPASPAVLFSLAQIAYETKQPDEARRHLQRYLDLPRAVPRDNAPALLFMAQIDEEADRLDAAIDWLSKVPRGEQFAPATIKRALLMSRQGRVEAAREVLRDAPVNGPRERAQMLSAESQLLRDAKRNQEAFDVLDKGLERLPDQPDLLYDHAMAAERIDRLPQMEASLRRLIALRPDYAHAYNALGYTFADRNVRLDEARTLIEKALQLAPDDAHILDSMGWVLFRQKDYPGALEYLRKAYDKRPEVEIAAHLGEVLWAMGRRDEARALWREARGREPDNTTLRETLARLNVAL